MMYKKKNTHFQNSAGLTRKTNTCAISPNHGMSHLKIAEKKRN